MAIKKKKKNHIEICNKIGAIEITAPTLTNTAHFMLHET